MNPSLDDCYFYYYSTCTKGNDCPYRHCELALGTETVCSLWREGLCTRKSCKFRHMESRINRTKIPCYWENQPGGCRKPHCVFYHQKTHSANALSEKQKLIFPLTTQASGQTPVVAQESDTDKVLLSKEVSENSSLSPTVPVPPVVVSLNDGEESDTESMSSTAKSYACLKDSTQSKCMLKNSENDDFGIKTLEQLRMEKIHRESEHFYKSVYDAPSLENVPMKLKVENPLYPRDLFGKVQKQSLPEKLEAYPEDHSTPNIVLDDPLEEKSVSSDLRSVLKRKQEGNDHKQSEFKVTTNEPGKRVISLKRSKGNTDTDSASITVTLNKEVKSESSLNFQTLHQM